MPLAGTGAAGGGAAPATASAVGTGSVLAPAAVQLDEVVPRLGGELLGFDPTEGGDRRPHLSQVLGAVRAAPQVGLEPGPLAPRQRAFQVVGDELDRLLA